MHIYDFQLYNLDTNHRTVLGSTFKCERWGHQVRELYLALRILYLRHAWGYFGHLLWRWGPSTFQRRPEAQSWTFSAYLWTFLCALCSTTYVQVTIGSSFYIESFYFIPNLALLSALTILLLRVQLSIPPCSNYGSNAAIPASLRWISAHHQSPFLLIVLLTVLMVNAFPMTVMFGMCSIFLFMASILQRRLMVIAKSHKSSKFSVLDASPEKFSFKI